MPRGIAKQQSYVIVWLCHEQAETQEGTGFGISGNGKVVVRSPARIEVMEYASIEAATEALDKVSSQPIEVICGHKVEYGKRTFIGSPKPITKIAIKTDTPAPAKRGWPRGKPRKPKITGTQAHAMA